MRKRLLYGFAAVLLVISVVLVVWQGSFRLRQFDHPNPGQTLIFWAISILIIILMLTLGWILFRTGIKLYIERQSNQEGSRIRTKLVVGALALSSLPVFCLVLFSYEVMNVNLNAWFTEPVQHQVEDYVGLATTLHNEMQDETNAQAALLASQPETLQLLAGGIRTAGFLERFCKDWELESAAILPPPGGQPLASWGPYTARTDANREVNADYFVRNGPDISGSVVVRARIPLDTAAGKARIDERVKNWHEIFAERKDVRRVTTMLMVLIGLFVLRS